MFDDNGYRIANVFILLSFLCDVTFIICGDNI